MTEEPQMHKDTESFLHKFDDETLDCRQFDWNDNPNTDDNVDLVDEDKIELAESAERESDSVIGDCSHYASSGCFPFMSQGYFTLYRPQNFPPPPPYGGYVPQVGAANFPGYQRHSMNPTLMNSSGAGMVGGVGTKGSGSVHGPPPNGMYCAPQSMGSFQQPLFLPQCPSLPHSSTNSGDLLKKPTNNNFCDFTINSLNKNAKPQKNSQSHIKKPLNAFMIYMREVRPTVLRHVQHKDSTTINQMIGKMWQALTKEEQALFFEKARIEKEHHKLMYPEYNPRDFYAQTMKKRRKKRGKHDNGEPLPKKCRARFGLTQQEKWCKHCKRKKRCLRYIDENEDSPKDGNGRVVPISNDQNERELFPSGFRELLDNAQLTTI